VSKESKERSDFVVFNSVPSGTIWDIEKQVPLTQLIAHDKEVFDIAFQGEAENPFKVLV
jgi:hypothetical protein